MLSLYTLVLVVIHAVNAYQNLPRTTNFLDDFTSAALAAAFREAPHTFLVGGISLMVAIQLISLGVLALQNKRYFEELFHLGTKIYKYNRENDRKL